MELEARHQDIRSLQDALGHAERRAQEAESMRDELAAAQGAREAVQARELATMQTARDAARTDHERTRERLEALRRSIEEALGDEGAAPEEPARGARAGLTTIKRRPPAAVVRRVASAPRRRRRHTSAPRWS